MLLEIHVCNMSVTEKAYNVRPYIEEISLELPRVRDKLRKKR